MTRGRGRETWDVRWGGARARGASAVRQRRSALASCWGVHESCVVSVSRVRSQQAFMHLTSPTFVVCTLVCTKSTDHAPRCALSWGIFHRVLKHNVQFSNSLADSDVAYGICGQPALQTKRAPDSPVSVRRPSVSQILRRPPSFSTLSLRGCGVHSFVRLSLSLSRRARDELTRGSVLCRLAAPGSPAAALHFLPCWRHLIAASARLLRGVPFAGRLASLVVPRVIRSARGHAHAVVLPRCGGSGCVMVAWRWMWGAVVNVAVAVDMVEMVA